MAGVGDVEGEGDSRRNEGCSWSSCVVAILAVVRDSKIRQRYWRSAADSPPLKP